MEAAPIQVNIIKLYFYIFQLDIILLVIFLENIVLATTPFASISMSTPLGENLLRMVVVTLLVAWTSIKVLGCDQVKTLVTFLPSKVVY